MTKEKTLKFNRCAVQCLLCIAVAMMAGCSDRKSEQHRAEGDTKLQRLNQIPAAREAYEKALEANPNNAMAKLGLARCSVAEENVDDALALFQEAIALAPELEEAYAEGVRVLANADRLDEALDLATSYSEQVPIAGGALRGVVLMKMGRNDEAIEVLTALNAAYPDSETVELDLGAALLAGGKTEEAEAIFQALTDGSSTAAVAARMGLIDVYRVQGRIDELVTQFAKIAEERPEDAGIKIGYGRSLLLADRHEEAEAIARDVLEVDPESGWANYIVGYCKTHAGAFDEAKAFLQQAERALPEEADVKALLEFAASGGKATPLKQAAAPTDSAGVEKMSTWRSLWKQAALNTLLANRDLYIAESGDSAREVLTLAALFTYQAELSRELAAGLPESSKIRGFVDAFMSKDAATVAKHFEGWETEDPDELSMRDNALGFSMVAGGSREKGLSVFLFCVERWPDHGVAMLNISQVFRRLGQPVIAAQTLQRLIALYPDNIDAHKMHYAALREGKAYDAARRAAEASYTLFPEEKWSHLYLCQAYLDSDNPGMALRWLERATSQFPNDPELQAILGRVLVRIEDCGQAETVLGGISTSAPEVMATRATLSTICRATEGDWDGVARIASETDMSVRSDSLALLLASSQIRRGELDEARATLKRADGESIFGGRFGLIITAALGEEGVAISPEEQTWSTTLGADPVFLADYCTVVAMQIADLNDQAWKFYQANLAERTPHVALTQIAFRSLAEADSIENPGEKARAVAESLADDPRAWLGLAQVLGATDDGDGESEAIVKALAVGPKSPEALYRHAVLMEKQGDIDSAIADYRVLLEISPDNSAASNNLAYMLLLVGGSDEEALKYAKVASEKLPRDAGVLHTYGLALMRTGALDDSRIYLERAAEIDPANPTIMFDYGRLLAKLDDKTEAHRRVRYAIAMSKNAGIDFPQLADAEALLGTLQ